MSHDLLPLDRDPAVAENRFPATASRSNGYAPSIALFGAFGGGNLGNDGTLEAMLNALRQLLPDAQFTVICHDPDYVAEKFAVPALAIKNTAGSSRVHRSNARKVGERLANLYWTLKAVRRFDSVILPGTGMLDDFGERPLGMPYEILKWCLAARLTGSKVMFISIGAGPIDNRINRFLMKSAARTACYRSYRDLNSKEFLHGIGLDTSTDPVYPDLAFLLPAPNEISFRHEMAPLTVGLGVMNYRGWYGFSQQGANVYGEYIRKMAEFAGYLLERGCNIRFLTGEFSDLSAIEDVIKRIGSRSETLQHGRLTAEPASSLHELMHQMAATDIVVATRFHNIVCALKLGKPTISVGYAKKNALLMESVGLGGFCHHAQHFDVALLENQFETMLASKTEIAATVRRRTAPLVDSLRMQNLQLVSLIQS